VHGFGKYSGILLVVVGEAIAVLGFAAYIFINEAIDIDVASMIGYIRWVVDHVNDIARFLDKLDTYEGYALGAGVLGAVMLAGGLVLLLRLRTRED